MNECCLKQDKITFNHGKIVKIYIVYALKSTINYNEDITLKGCSLGAVKLTKSLILVRTNILDMVLDLMEKELFHIQVVDLVTMSLSVHVDNKKKRYFNSW